MTVTQMYQLVNDVREQVFGQDSVKVVDVTSLGTFGKFLANHQKGYELFHKGILDRMIKVVIDNELFTVEDIPFLANNYEYGGFWEEIYFDMPQSQETPSWNVGDDNFSPELPGVEKLPISVKTYGKDVVTFSRRWTLPDVLLNSAFLNNEGLSAYISGVGVAVENSVRVDIMNVARLVRAKFFASVINTSGTESVVNALSEYITETGDDTLDATSCWTSKKFLNFLAEFIARYPKRFATVGSHYINEKTANGTDYIRQTGSDHLVFEVLSDVANKMKYNLESDVYHNDLVKLPKYHEVTFWQGRGDDTLGDYSTINVKLGEDDNEEAIVVKQTGIIGAMYDDRAIVETYRDPYRWAKRMDEYRYTTYGIETNLGYAFKLSYPTVIFVVEDVVSPSEGD